MESDEIPDTKDLKNKMRAICIGYGHAALQAEIDIAKVEAMSEQAEAINRLAAAMERFSATPRPEGSDV